MTVEWSKGYTDGPNESNFYTAGINIKTRFGGATSIHGNAIEFHGDSKFIVEARRDVVLEAVKAYGLTVKE